MDMKRQAGECIEVLRTYHVDPRFQNLGCLVFLLQFSAWNQLLNNDYRTESNTCWQPKNCHVWNHAVDLQKELFYLQNYVSQFILYIKKHMGVKSCKIAEAMPSGITWRITQGLCASNMLGHALRWLQMDFWPLTGWLLHSNCQLSLCFFCHVQLSQELQNLLKSLVVWCCFDVFCCSMSYLSSVTNMDYTTVDPWIDLDSQIPQLQDLLIC